MTGAPPHRADHEWAMEERSDGEAVLLAIRGVVDMAAAPALADRVGTILRRRPPVLVLDLTGVTFLATAGMSIIMEADRRCRDTSAACRVVASGAVTLRPMQLLGIADLLELYPTVAAAVQAQ